MLRKNVTRAVRPMLDGLVRRGVALEALNETPIAELVEFSQPEVTAEEVEAIQAAESTSTAVLELVEATSEITGTHDVMIENLVAQGTASVENTIAKARDVVMPAIATIAEQVTKSVDRALTPPNDVIVYSIPAFVTSQTINSLFSQYEGAKVELNTITDLPHFTAEQLAALLETGSVETNEMIADYLATKPEGALEVIIADVIRGSRPEVSGYINAVDYGAGAAPYIRRDINVLPAVVLAAVILRNLYDNPPAGVNISIIGWNEHVVSAMAGLAANYHVLLSDVANYVASGQLYLPSTLRQGTYVNEMDFPILDRVYDKFLDSDGFPEVLFALTLDSNSLRMSGNDALANKEVLSSKWAEHCNTFRNKAMHNLSERARDIVYSEIGKLIKSLDLNELAVTPSEIWDAIRKSGENTKFTPENLYPVIRFLVAGILFGRYRTLPLLTAMDDYMETHPDCSPRVAAYHGTKAYVCQWVADQIQKVPA